MWKDPGREAIEILSRAVEQYQPGRLFALFSGGHDSLSAAHLASQHPRFDGCVHINTGIGVEETREYVRQTCRDQGWPLREYTPPLTYDEIVLRYGFPGPAGHRLVYNRLKERCLRQLVREHKRYRRDHILLVSGIRRAESRRRMAIPTGVQKEGSRVWVAPLLEWSAGDKERYIDQHHLPRNPVVRTLSMSGECLCGAFARPGEITLLEQFYPAAAARIRELESRASAAGVPAQWGKRPKKAAAESDVGGVASLCWSCAARHEATEQPLLQLAVRG